MTRQPIGLHATNQRSAELYAVIEQLQPTVMLILNGLGEAVHIHERLGVPYVFHRVYDGNEGTLWNQRLSAYKSPSKWIDEWRSQGHPQIARVVLNEPHASSEEEMGRLLDYLMDVGDRAAAAGFKASLGGFATANTIREGWLWNDAGRTTWHYITVYDKFLRWAADWSAAGHGFIDWHNYSTFPPVDGNGGATALLDPAQCQRGQWKTRQQVLETAWRDNWLFYRDVWLAKRCEALGVPMHRVVYGEGWADAMPNLASIYSQLEAQLPGLKVEGPFSMHPFYSSRFPGQTQAAVMRQVSEWIVDTMPDYVVGLCFFAWNFNAPWHNNRAAGGRMYNVGERPDVLTEMYKLKDLTTMPEPVDYKVPVPKPANAGVGQQGILSEDYNLRIGPDKLYTTGYVTIRKNSTVTWYPASITGSDGDNLRWGWVEFNNQRGWMAYQGQFKAVPVTPPPPAPPPPAEHLVHVPFVSQVGNVNANDCGPACVASVIRWVGLQNNNAALQAITARDVSVFLNHGNNTTSLGQLVIALNHWGIQSTSRGGLNLGLRLASIRAEIDAGRPVIMLVHRADLKPTFDSFMGSHFITVVGYTGDDWFYYHDPLGATAAQGEIIPVRTADFEAAIYETPGNVGLHYAGVGVALPIVAPPPPPDPEPPNNTAYALVFVIDGDIADNQKDALRTAFTNAINGILTLAEVYAGFTGDVRIVDNAEEVTELLGDATVAAVTAR